jgi:hypothetical protein
MTVWILVMITLVPGVPRSVAEASPVYVGVFDSSAKCTSAANASNNTENGTHVYECLKEHVL